MTKLSTLFFYCAALALAQSGTNLNKITIIPAAPTGGAVGEVDFQSKDKIHHVGLAAPDTATANVTFRLPSGDIPGGGCFTTDGAYNGAISPCGGNNGMPVSPANPLLLYAHFRDDQVAMFLDASRDYLNYHPVSKHAVYIPTNNRDISVMWNGTRFWFICTAEGVIQSDNTDRHYEPQLWSSTDLIHFTPRQRVDISSIVTSGSNAGAPEWYQPKVTGDKLGFWLHALGTGLTTDMTWFITFDPEVCGISAPTCTPTTGNQIVLNGTTAQSTQGQALNVFDFFPYYDPGSAKYYLLYADFADCGPITNSACGQPAQRIAYAMSTTQLGTYTQVSPTFNNAVLGSGDYFGFTPVAGNTYLTNGAEGPQAIALADSVARYGIANCVRVYADTWTFQFGAGPPVIGPNIFNVFNGPGFTYYPNGQSSDTGDRIYQWSYRDTCPATLGGDPFATLMNTPQNGTLDNSGLMTVTVNAYEVATGLDIHGNTIYATHENKILWNSGPTFSYMNAGGTVSLNGHTYTILSIDTPGSLTLTTDIYDPGNVGLYLMPMYVGAMAPVHISNGEQGTVIALTDQASANIVYAAEEYWRDDSRVQSRFIIGGKEQSIYTVTAMSDFSSYSLSNDESPTYAAGGVDPGARFAKQSFALWSGCGVSPISCPQPGSGEANWVSRYAGSAPSLQLDNSAFDVGESSIMFSNSMANFGVQTLTAASLGSKALWRVGSNSQAFGPLVRWNGTAYTGNDNAANNWFYIQNVGLGPHLAGPLGLSDPLISNPGFEGSGTGSLSGWSHSGTVTAVATSFHYGGHSAKLATGATLYQTLSGLVPNTLHVVTAWVKSDGGATTGINIQVQFGLGSPAPNLATYNCQLSSDVTKSCISLGQWTQIGFQYASDNTGIIQVTFTNPSGGSGNFSYVDDVSVYPYATPAGAYVLGISPSTGEVRINYGLTLGNDQSAVDPSNSTSLNSSFPFTSIDSSAPGVTNIGDGTLGHHNGTVQLAGVRMGNSTTPDNGLGASGIFGITQTNVTGAWTELLHHANDDNVYLDNYGQFGACTVISCAPITGGGDIYLRPNNSPVGNVFVQGNLKVADFGTLTGAVGYLDVLGIGGNYSGLPLVVNYNNRASNGTIGVFQQNSAAITDGALVNVFKTMSTATTDVAAYSFTAGLVGAVHTITIGGSARSYTQVVGDTGPSIARALAQVVNAVDTNASAMQSSASVYLSPRFGGGSTVATSSTGTLISGSSNITERYISKGWSLGILNGLGVGDFSILEDAGPGGYGTERLKIKPGGNVVIAGNLTASVGYLDVLGIGGDYSLLPLVVNYNNRASNGTVAVLQQNSAAITDGALLNLFKTMSTATTDAPGYSFTAGSVGTVHTITIAGSARSYTQVANDTGPSIARALAQVVNAVDTNASAMQTSAIVYLSPRFGGGSTVATSSTGTLITGSSNITERYASKGWSVGVLNGLNVKDFSILEDAGPGGYGTERLKIKPGGTVVIGGQGDIGGLRSTAGAVAGSGVGTEILYDSGTDSGFLETYNRSTSTLKPLFIDATVLHLNAGANGPIAIGALGDLQYGIVSGNGSLFGFNALNVAGVYKSNVGGGGNRSGYIEFDNLGMNIVVTPTTQSSNSALVGPVIAMNVGIGGDSSFGTVRSTFQTVPPSGVGTELTYDGTGGYLFAYDRGASVYKPLSLTGSAITLTTSPSGSISMIGNVAVTGSISATAGGTNSSNAVTCSAHTITGTVTSGPGAGGSVSITACDSVATNSFSHGIKQ